jgi:prevent-host-death family protein
MQPISAIDARARLNRLIDETVESHEPILITGQHNNAVLVSEQDWQAIQETLYLLSVPGLHESVQAGLKTPIENCDTELPW